LSHDGNMAHFTASGRTPRGERSGKAKATTQSVIDMRNRASTGETLASIARHYGMSEPGVAAIVRRRVWRHVP
jgi:Mor family transcriptional regulator